MFTQALRVIFLNTISYIVQDCNVMLNLLMKYMLKLHVHVTKNGNHSISSCLN